MSSVASWYVGTSRTVDVTCVSCIGRQILYHWTTREAHSVFLFSLESPLYTMDTKSLDLQILCKYFLQVCDSSFYLVNGVFHEVKIFNKVQLLIFFSFMDQVFDVMFKTLFLALGPKDILLFSSKSFVVSFFMFKFVIHFAHAFVYTLSFKSRFIFVYRCLVIPRWFVEKILFPPLKCFCILINNQLMHLHWSISGLPVPLIYVSLPLPVSLCIDYSDHTVRLYIR